MKISSKNKIFLGFGGAFLLLLVAFFYSTLNITRLLQHIHLVNNTNYIVHHLEGLSLEVKNLEGSFNNKMPLDSTVHTGYYRHTLHTIDSLYHLIREDAAGDYVATVRLEKMNENIEHIRANILTQINTQKKGRPHPVLAADNVRQIIDSLQTRITDMEASEKALLVLQSGDLNSASDSTVWINIIIVGLALVLAAYSLIVFNKENKAKRKANHITVEYIQTLEIKMRELSKAHSELSKLRDFQKFMATGRIARIIAHEVRNPLTNINLSCDELKESAENNETSAKFLETIMRNSDRINHLIGELLQVTRIEDLKLKKVSINQMMDETLEMAKDRIQLQHVEVRKYYSSTIPPIEAEAERLKIAFLNIIINAVEAMQGKNGLLTLRTENKNNKCIVAISDNGRGIDKEMIDKIFDPYYTGKEKGTGLGLANTQNIIMNHKGAIEVDSEPGTGTTFTVTLNFARR